jgi:hypothetical protein
MTMPNIFWKNIETNADTTSSCADKKIIYVAIV